MVTFQISGNLVDLINREIFPAQITVKDEKIKKIDKLENATFDNYIMPGFVDAHIHIESSMLPPSEFARMAVVHGTVATVSDPHEIANVLGIGGVKFMIDNGNSVPFKFNFGAPSCVPATGFETAGAEISADDIRTLFRDYDIKYLSEMMNFPGVLFDDPMVMEKLAIAKEFGYPIDGHAPGIKDEQTAKYVGAGISTDHECTTMTEAIDKIYHGMKILIREGSAAKNYETLFKLIEARPEMCMFCSDDKHPDDLAIGHINELVRRTIKDHGYNLYRTLDAAILNPINHYGLDVGMLREGDDADFIEVGDLKDFSVLKTFIRGELVAENGKSKIESKTPELINNFKATEKNVEDFRVEAKGSKIRVIEALDSELLTNQLIEQAKIENGNAVADIDQDILKLAVVNRYDDEKPALGFIKNIGLKRGAIASSVGHDSHNITAVGTSDKELCRAVNEVIKNKGGMAIVDGDSVECIPLPIAGLMSHLDGYEVGKMYARLNQKAREMGSELHAPFMTLSFMALLVIPFIKLSDKGLFDGTKFEFINLWTD
jgi:adenine deaminase